MQIFLKIEAAPPNTKTNKNPKSFESPSEGGPCLSQPTEMGTGEPGHAPAAPGTCEGW